MESFKIAILIPAYNEANTLGEVIKKTSIYGDVIVVDDGSEDNTYDIAKNNNVTVLQNVKNLGYDSALNVGINYIIKNNYEYLITFDADNQHQSFQLESFIKLITTNKYGAVIGIRSKVNRVSEFFFNYFFNYLYNINDVLCGFKAYNISILKKINDLNFKKSLGTRLALLIAFNKINIKEINITVNERKDSSRIGGKIKSNLIIIKTLIINIKEIVFWKIYAK